VEPIDCILPIACGVERVVVVEHVIVVEHVELIDCIMLIACGADKLGAEPINCEWSLSIASGAIDCKWSH
jgi:hypothetical protein